jgi:hypothetical protein
MKRGNKMSKNKKSDKGRFKDNRGIGRGENYKPWIKGHEFSSDGYIHRLIGWKQRRLYQLFSNLEYNLFLISQFSDNVIDVREQVPLLPLELTVCIANELGVKHPAEFNQRGKETVRTTDFIFTVRDGEAVKDIAKSVKQSKDLDDERTRKLLKIEEEYWKRKNIDWSIITENQIPKTMAENIAIIYNDFFWSEEHKYSNYELDIYIHKFKNDLIKNNMDAYRTLCQFEEEVNWKNGEGLNFFKFMLAKKVIKTDMNTAFNFKKMKIWL